jgi:hypothetical protein
MVQRNENELLTSGCGKKKQKLKIINIAEKASTKADRMYQEFNYL